MGSNLFTLKTKTMTPKNQKIKELLIAGKTLEEIRIECKTSWRTIYRIIEDNGLQEYRSKVGRDYKAKNAAKMNTPQARENKKQTILERRNEKSLFGNKAKEQNLLDQKVKAQGYPNCSDYIQKNGAASFKANILGK